MARHFATDEDAAKSIRNCLTNLHVAINQAKKDGLDVVVDWGGLQDRLGSDTSTSQRWISISRSF